MLESSTVSRSLDRKTLIFWLEVIDIFILVSICSVLNFIFHGTGFKLYGVYLPTLILTISLVIAKRGRPDGFLKHFARFHSQRKSLSCFEIGPAEFRMSDAWSELRKVKR